MPGTSALATRVTVAEFNAGHLRHTHTCAAPLLQAERLVLRHIGLDPDHVAVHQREHRHAAGGVGLHQAAVVDVALGDDAVERRHHPLIGLGWSSTSRSACWARMFASATATAASCAFRFSRSVSACLTRNPALAGQIAIAAQVTLAISRFAFA